MRCCRTNCCLPNDRNRFGNSHRTKPIKSYSPTNYLYPGSSCPAFSCRRDVCSLEKKNSGNKTTNKLKMFSRRSIASCPKARRKKVSRRGDGESHTIFRLSSIYVLFSPQSCTFVRLTYIHDVQRANTDRNPPPQSNARPIASTIFLPPSGLLSPALVPVTRTSQIFHAQIMLFWGHTLPIGPYALFRFDSIVCNHVHLGNPSENMHTIS